MAAFSRFTRLALFVLAVGIGMAALLMRHEWRPPPATGTATRSMEAGAPGIVGAEAGAIARHLVQGQGFGTPFDLSPPPAAVSPSTHLPPLYPLFLAAGMKAGLSDSAVFYMALVVNLLATGLLPLAMLRLGRVAGFPRGVSLLAAGLMCVCPESLRAVGLIWDEALLTLAGTWMAGWMIGRLNLEHGAKRAGAWGSAMVGVMNGVLALLNPAMCIAIPCAWLAGLRARGMGWGRLVLQGLLVGGTTFLASSPWHVRNWLLLDPPAKVFIRGNFWLEVWSSLHPIARLTYPDATVHMIPVHPWNGSESLLRTDVTPPRKLTEQEYYAWCRERVFEAFREQPRLVLGQVAEQFNGFWLGMAEARRWFRNPWVFFAAQGVPVIAGIAGYFLARKRMGGVPAAVLCAMLIVFPLPYYLTGGAARYRHPIDPLLYMGVAWLAYLAVRRVQLEKRQPGEALGTEKP